MSTTCRYRVGISSAFSIVTLALSFSTCASFAIDKNGLSFGKNMQVKAGTDVSENSVDIESRRDFVSMAPTVLISCITGLHVLTSESAPALAADKEEPLPTREVVTEAFDFIRFELNNPEGGVAYMQGRIDQEDLEGLLEFSKTYDLEFRKRRFGGAKKLFRDKEVKSKGTEYANAVTFDLIGINRSCRKGQENVASANKYLQELRDDVNKFLALEKTIEVQ